MGQNWSTTFSRWMTRSLESSPVVNAVNDVTATRRGFGETSEPSSVSMKTCLQWLFELLDSSFRP